MMICNKGLHCPLCDDTCPSYIEVKEVIYSHWITPTVINGKSFNIPHCAHCGSVPCGIDENTKFCPNCGAEMIKA